jgi:DNA-binding LacI/PurR family transcriptional regulator
VFLGRMVRPSAVLCYNDLVAAGVYKAAAECSAAIPRDLSVVGIDGIELSSVFGPPLTTVVQPCREMGTAMAEILLEQMNGSATASPRSITFEPRLLARGSVRRM